MISFDWPGLTSDRPYPPLALLEQLADETGIEMGVLFGMVQHLEVWGKVRLIHTLTHESVLCIHPNAPFRPILGDSVRSSDRSPATRLCSPSSHMGSASERCYGRRRTCRCPSAVSCR